MTDHQTVPTDMSDADGAERAADSTRPRRSPVRRLLVVGLVAGLAVIAFGLWWFQPQALFIDDVVDEAFPAGADADGSASAPTDEAVAASDDGEASPDPNDGEAAPDPDDGEAAPDPDPPAVAGADEPAAAATPVPLRSGTFSSRNRYEVSGTATAFALDDTERILRLEDFESTNGPDLFVYLTAADASATDPQLDADVVDLGILTGNIGNQNYVIPPEVDLDVYDTVVIWCRRFATSFGVADLVVATD